MDINQTNWLKNISAVVARINLWAYTNRQTQFEIYRCKSEYHSKNNRLSLSTVRNQIEPYKVHGNDKGKAKHLLNLKKSLKLYKLLNKNDYKYIRSIEI